MSILSRAGLLIAGQAFQDVLIRNKGRNIAGIIPQVVVQERHHDELAITEQPTELGVISDHAYKLPSELFMRCGWSKSGSLFNIGLGIAGAGDVYDQLRALQDAREPISLQTGKRKYDSMLLRSIDVITDASTENAFIADLTFRQVIIVQTQNTLLPTSKNSANPAQTTPPVDMGTKQPKPVPQSILSKGYDWVFGP